MRLAILFAALAVPTATPPSPPAVPGKASEARGPTLCPDDVRLRQVRERRGEQLSRLGELPPGDLILGVYREERGCIRPLVVREGIGAGR